MDNRFPPVDSPDFHTCALILRSSTQRCSHQRHVHRTATPSSTCLSQNETQPPR
ncbi:hypothetical protein HMPREF9570_00383 [Cutibacterium acnes HL043PA1]|nr:hypothetical protein HMPREF9570_00383 [Cutibacterium acnes HL043PA1]